MISYYKKILFFLFFLNLTIKTELNSCSPAAFDLQLSEIALKQGICKFDDNVQTNLEIIHQSAENKENKISNAVSYASQKAQSQMIFYAKEAQNLKAVAFAYASTAAIKDIDNYGDINLINTQLQQVATNTNTNPAGGDLSTGVTAASATCAGIGLFKSIMKI